MRGLQSILGPFSLITGTLGLAAIVLSALLYLLLPELQDANRTLLGVGLILLTIFFLGAFEQVKAALMARQARYGTNVTVMVIAFVGIGVAVNFVAANNPKRFDVTASRQFTLARQTVNILKSLDKPIKVTGFFTPDPPGQASQQGAENLLKEYAYYSGGKISYEFIDPEAKPAVAREYEIRDYGALVFDYDGRRRQVLGIGEQDFTGAILSITGKEQKKIYFLSGHGEHDPEGSEGNGYSQADQGLRADNYNVGIVDISVASRIPDDAAVLIVAGPQKDLVEREMAPLENYILRGGRVLFMVDPNPPASWRNLLAKWGLKLEDGRIIDQRSFANPDVATPAAQRDQYYLTQITKDLATTFFPGAAGLSLDIPEDDRENISIVPMIVTSFLSWLETDSQQVAYNEGTDTRGPLPLAVTVEAKAPIGGRPQSASGAEVSRFVVFADSDFASNEFFYSLGNSDLFLNTVNWLAAQEELISIRPKPPEFRRIVVTQRAWNWILYSSILFLPGVVIMAGAVSWWRRR
ncbi:MAG: transp aux protein [Dehalococcoidia bacterium]|nr:transp aux protein [Dehalococcoidia bacterium]